jgi:hypothetical protein
VRHYVPVERPGGPIAQGSDYNARKSLEGIDGGVIEIETEPDGDLVAVRILDPAPTPPTLLTPPIDAGAADPHVSKNLAGQRGFGR